MRHRYGFSSVAAAVALVLAGGCSPAPGSTVPAGQSRNDGPGGATDVNVSRDPSMGPNALCVRYCQRVAQCASSLPHSDPMLGPKDVEQRCRADQNDCKKPTTEAHCCERVTECGDFAHCFEQSRDVPSDCSAVGSK
jgi:hypothetical protein